MSFKKVIETAQRADRKFNIFSSIRNDLPSSSKDGLPLSGMFTAIKDNMVTTKEPTTCSSQMLKNYVSPFESTVTSLLEKNGATIIGKTNMDEFGMGSATTHSIFGPTLNPLYPDEKRVCGGSSGGSAAAVASGVADFTIGTDTGGSVRLPAAYCGVIGFKPTYGRISRWGVIAYSQSLDTVGILADKVDTVKKVYKVLDQFDPQDPTSIGESQRQRVLSLSKLQQRPIRFGIIEEFNLKEMSKETLEAWSSILSHIISEGHEIVRLSMPVIKAALPAYYTLAPAEASSNLARYDGVRYGHRSELGDSEEGNLQFAPTRNEGFGNEVQRRILMGTYNLSSEAFNNHFLKAQAIRDKLCDQFDSIFKANNMLSSKKSGNEDGVDFIISPTAMTAAPLLENFKNSENQNPVNAYVNDVLTVPSSLAGLPTISIPWTVLNSKVPIGIQISGQRGYDDQVLDIVEKLI